MELNKVYQNPKTKEYFYVAKKLDELTYEVWNYSDPAQPNIVSEQDVLEFRLYDRIDDETWAKMERLIIKMDMEDRSGIFSNQTLIDSLELLCQIPRTPYIPEVSEEDALEYLNECGFNLATPLKRIQICSEELRKLAPNAKDSIRNKELWVNILFILDKELEPYRRKDQDAFFHGPVFAELKLEDLYDTKGDCFGKSIEKCVNTSSLIIEAIDKMCIDKLGDLALAICFIDLSPGIMCE